MSKYKYSNIFLGLWEALLNLKDGDFINIYDIAKKANVSISTVSRVMNNTGSVSEKTRKKVESVIESLDYSPNNIARSLASKKSMLIGLMVPDIRNYFHVQAAYEVDRILKTYGYTSLLSNTTKDLDEKIRILKLQKQQQVEGIITIGSDYGDKEFLEVAYELNKTIPIVQLNNYDKDLVSVYCDEKDGMRQVLHYLKENSYKTPIFISTTQNITNRAYNEKRKGYENSLKNYFPDQEFLEINLEETSLEELLEIIKEKNIDAIQCENDSIAIKVYKYLSVNNIKIPEDVAIIGFDNISATNYTQKKLSSIDHRIYDHSKVAVQALIKLINEEKVEKNNVIKPKLVIKETC